MRGQQEGNWVSRLDDFDYDDDFKDEDGDDIVDDDGDVDDDDDDHIHNGRATRRSRGLQLRRRFSLELITVDFCRTTHLSSC